MSTRDERLAGIIKMAQLTVLHFRASNHFRDDKWSEADTVQKLLANALLLLEEPAEEERPDAVEARLDAVEARMKTLEKTVTINERKIRMLQEWA